ncbi:HAMP domain-containing sensor histidine kinase [Raineyella sp. W15-4]|uniref:sensor histidine kinase n=1 Tax=Raineyella sp. W15-4 TaxID=3081651 RepID=UPI002953A0F5|nr:HAMP domain-containing sensor histidine kinase [Raineyella sp. W15-4]WOQ16133.1 HAMP domain-containing sensor histidine kinase [Raineyella sp. W15-4]
MLNPADLLLIGLTALGCTAGVTGLALLVLRIDRRGSLGRQLVVVVVAAIASIVCSTVVIAAEMYFSRHDLLVLIWVIVVSTTFSLMAAWFTVRATRMAMATLSESARRIGDGDVVEARVDGWREFNELGAQLADASERLAAARADVERLDASRRQLVAWVSHDLRTPLTGMRVMAEALEEGLVDDPLEYIRQIRLQVDRVNLMVDDLFELSKIHSGTLRLCPEPVVLVDLASDAVADIRPLAALRGIRVTHGGMADDLVLADPRALTRVITNLLSNSIRYAPEHSEVLVSTHRLDDDQVAFSVKDAGGGVAPSDLERMFDVGWRGSLARMPGPQSPGSGAGLGLAIVQGIVEAHGGEVRATHVHDGFRVDIVLPRAIAHTAGGAPSVGWIGRAHE